jgi:predicted RNA binding protein YcfA (HicA-like mRNA interferase family)
LKPLSGRELAKLLEQHGWELRRVTGSHHIYAKPERPERLSLPIHGNQPLKLGLQRHLLKLAGLEAFL